MGELKAVDKKVGEVQACTAPIEQERDNLRTQATMQGEVSALSRQLIEESEETTELRQQLSQLEKQVASAELNSLADKHEQARLQKEIKVLEADTACLEGKAAKAEEARAFN